MDLVLADRDVQVTLKRTWRRLSLWNKLKVLFVLLSSALGGSPRSTGRRWTTSSRRTVWRMS